MDAMDTSEGSVRTKREKGRKPCKSGLIFPPRKAIHMHKARKTSVRPGPDSIIIVTAALQCVAAEVLELAGNIVKKENGTIIDTHHIFHAVRNDQELSSFLVPLLVEDEKTEVDDLFANISL